VTSDEARGTKYGRLEECMRRRERMEMVLTRAVRASWHQPEEHGGVRNRREAKDLIGRFGL
jgi:hypothetical protein